MRVKKCNVGLLPAAIRDARSTTTVCGERPSQRANFIWKASSTVQTRSVPKCSPAVLCCCGGPSSETVERNFCRFWAEFEHFRPRFCKWPARVAVEKICSCKLLPNCFSKRRHTFEHPKLPGIFHHGDDRDVLPRNVLGAYDLVAVEQLNFKLRSIA